MDQETAFSITANNPNHPCDQPHAAAEINDTPSFMNSPETLAQLVETNDFNSLQEFGGIQHVAAALETDLESGIAGDQIDLYRRREAFGCNQYLEDEPSLITKGLHQLVFEASKNTTIILLFCCAALSLAIGIKTNGAQEGITDGALVFLAIFVVAIVGVVCRYIKHRWVMRRKRLKHKKAAVRVVRQGKMQKVSVSELVVGDVVCLEKGNEVPADGLLIHGDHSSSSIFMGSKVAERNCKMLVTSVGNHTERSKLMRVLISKHKSNHYDSKLQTSIDKLSSNLENVWLTLSLLILVVQVFRCFVLESKRNNDHNPDPKGVKNTLEEFMNETTKILKKRSGKVNGLVAMLCILIFALRDCLPLGVYVTFLYASRRVKSVKGIVRKLPACATLGLITTICISKTEDIALQYTKMAELWIGMRRVEEISREVNQQLLQVFQESIYCTNGSGDHEGEDVLLCWAQKILGMDVDKQQKSCVILHCEALDLHRSYSAMIPTQGTEPGNNSVVVFWNGNPGEILPMCSYYCDVDGIKQTLDGEKREEFNKMLENIASDSLKCFAFAYKQVLEDEEDDDPADDDEKTLESMENGLTWLGLVSLKNPYSPKVREAVEACKQSGVSIKLVVRDDVKTAQIMALNSGIFRPGNDINQAIIDASIFRNGSDEDRMKMIDGIQVLANASSIDKLLMAQCLREKAEVEAVAGACSRDVPALKEADVGLLARDRCVKCGKEDADIVVLGPSIGMINTLVKFGKCVCHNLEKFIELQLTVNVAAFTINFIVVISSSDELQISPFQLLWVNLIMESLGAWALSIQMVDLPASEQPVSPVYGSDGRTITKTMSINIAVQSLFQVTISLILKFKGKAILHVDEGVLKTMIFVYYVLCQVFTLLAAMKIKRSSFLEGLFAFKNCLFLIVVGSIVIMQVALVEIMAIITHWRKLSLKLWCICTGIASVSMCISYAVNYYL